MSLSGYSKNCDPGTAKLAAFGAWCAKEFRDSLADIDGGSAQEAMEQFGVLELKTFTESCGENCMCVEYGPFPHACYAFPADVQQAMGKCNQL